MRNFNLAYHNGFNLFHNQGINTPTNVDFDEQASFSNLNQFHDQEIAAAVNRVNVDFDERAPFSSFNRGFPYNSAADHMAMVASDSQHPLTTSLQDFPVLDVEAAKKNKGPRLGLKLTITSSFFNLFGHLLKTSSHDKQLHHCDSTTSSSSKLVDHHNHDFVSPDKLKAVNFAALTLRIGQWKIASRHEGDLVAKCYFKKKKLVWEALQGNLKIKLEIQWSDISAIAKSSANGQGILDIWLEKKPIFYREVNPQPKKHTDWEQCDDFTSKQQASLYRRHTLEFAPGILEKYYGKIVQPDDRLRGLSENPFPYEANPFFDEIDFTNRFGFNNHPHSFSSHPRMSRSEFSTLGNVNNYSNSFVGRSDYTFVPETESQPQVTISSTPTTNQLVAFRVANANHSMPHMERSNNYALAHNYTANVQMMPPHGHNIPCPIPSHHRWDHYYTGGNQ